MKKPIEQKSPLAAWATTARAEAGMSVEEVVDVLAERGHAIRAATIRGIEGGSKGASARLRRLLGEIYDRPAPGQTETAAPDDPVAAAVDRLTAQMARIEERLADLAGAEEGRADALQMLLLQLVGRVGGSAGAHERLPAETR